MYQNFCETPTNVTRDTNTDRRNGLHQLLQCSRLDCETAVRSRPWKTLKNPTRLYISFRWCRPSFRLCSQTRTLPFHLQGSLMYHAVLNPQQPLDLLVTLVATFPCSLGALYRPVRKDQHALMFSSSLPCDDKFSHDARNSPNTGVSVSASQAATSRTLAFRNSSRYTVCIITALEQLP